MAQTTAVICLTFGLLVPAQAQFWSPFAPAPTRRPPGSIPQQQYNQQQYNPFGGFFTPPQEPRREAPVDYSHAPAPAPRHTDVAPTTSVVVVGDAMADWLAYGLEDAFSEQPEIAIIRKPRATSGLIRYDPRRDVDWAQAVREIIAAEKPKFIVMMIGTNDHQAIRDRVPAARTSAAGAAPGKAGAAPATPAATPDSELPALAGEDPSSNSEQTDNPEQASSDASHATSPSGPFEFHTDQWEAAYIKRIDATIAAMKSAGVPVIWVGLPAQRSARATSDASYLNELYRGRAEKAGIIYVDVWDGFVDEQGRYSAQGPDFEGQIRRLRSGDGEYFTKAGARKLAHYVEREIDHSMADRAVPVALPSTVELSPPGARPGGPAARPLAGPVIPLTVSTSGADELMGGARTPSRAAPNVDPLAARVLTKGEPISAPSGRADDFNWPRGSTTTVSADPSAQPPVTSTAMTTVPDPPPAANSSPGPAAAPAAKTAKPAAASSQRADADGVSEDSKPKPAKPKRAPDPPRPAPFSPFGLFH